jgi:hypothetical protein
MGIVAINGDRKLEVLPGVLGGLPLGHTPGWALHRLAGMPGSLADRVRLAAEDVLQEVPVAAYRDPQPLGVPSVRVDAIARLPVLQRQAPPVRRLMQRGDDVIHQRAGLTSHGVRVIDEPQLQPLPRFRNRSVAAPSSSASGSCGTSPGSSSPEPFTSSATALMR